MLTPDWSFQPRIGSSSVFATVRSAMPTAV
jgi:hypothetical protein